MVTIPVFSSYVETPWRVFIDRCNGLDPAWFPEAGYCIASSLVFMTLCMLAAWMVLARRDFRV